MVADDLRDPEAPPDLEISHEAPRPIEDPLLGVAVDPPAFEARHRLVTIGDSLTHGFRSLAIFDTQNSYPAVLARALGIEDDFRYPGYASPCGGLPLDLEWLFRELQREFGSSFELGESARLLRTVLALLEVREDYWERGDGALIPDLGGIGHNLAVYGWDLRDALSLDADVIRRKGARDDLFPEIFPDDGDALAALRVLNSAREPGGRALTPLKAAKALGEEGIETLIVWLGANNALRTILHLKVKWSGKDYADVGKKGAYTVWHPDHFRAELAEVVAAVREVRAQHVLWGTVPHVTIAPLVKGVGPRKPDSRYYPYYVRPWAEDEDVTEHPGRYPKLTAAQARSIDSAIDSYNRDIVAAVKAARQDGLDWGVVDIAGVLERLAERRYRDEYAAARPSWWDELPYRLPDELVAALGFRPTTQFLRTDAERVVQGGLVGLDGVHPTCSGYGVVAHEFMQAMRTMGVAFKADKIDFDAVVQADTLCTDPLPLGANTLDLLGELDDNFQILARFERAFRFVSPG